MITHEEIKRLAAIEQRVIEIANEEGLQTTDITFELVPPRRMFESMAYGFPTNYSHWTHGRDYDRFRTIYEHTGAGIPYETVWNFVRPRAFLVDNNPLALNALIIPHVVGHVDHFLRSAYFTHGRSFADIADEARQLAEKVREYSDMHGKEEVERLMDAGISLEWHQHPDPFHEEQDEDSVRGYLMAREKEKLRAYMAMSADDRKVNEENIRRCERRLKEMRHKTPPEPVYDLLAYVTERAERLHDWERDLLRLLRKQARALAPNRRVKMLAEGWASYWHVHIMRRLFEEGLLTAKEHGVYNIFHAKVTQAHKLDFNVYCIGLALFEYIKERWDKGRFGKEYNECDDPVRKANWDTKAMKGTEKIFEVSARYTDRMAIEEFFTDEFIHAMQLYVYVAEPEEKTGDVIYKIVENRPPIIRQLLKTTLTLFNMPMIAVVDGNHDDRGELYLRHYYAGSELEPTHRNGALMHIGYLWRRAVHLETTVEEKTKLYTYDGSKHSEKQLMLFPKST